MAKEFFKAHFFPEQFGGRPTFTNSLNYYLASLFFNAFPLPQRGSGHPADAALHRRAAGDGYSVLIFPEGKRTDRGEIKPFQPGVGMIASRLDVPVVPVRLEGLDRSCTTVEISRNGAGHGDVRPPMSLTGNDYAILAAQIEDAVRAL